VRSSINFVEFDIKHTLGFVANPRRFNGMHTMQIFQFNFNNWLPPVAITRAQALLIVIGDPCVLSLDPLWRGFMNYVYLCGGWKGASPDWDPEEPVCQKGGYDALRRDGALIDMEALIERIRTVSIESIGQVRALDEDDAHVDRPWREAD
jgi:helicase MOV-10